MIGETQKHASTVSYAGHEAKLTAFYVLYLKDPNRRGQIHPIHSKIRVNVLAPHDLYCTES